MADQTYKFTLIELSNGGEVSFDPTTTSVNLMTVGNSITAVLSERVFTPEEKAVMEKEAAAQAAFMEKLMAAQQGQPDMLPVGGFDFEDEEDDDEFDDD